jgi:hypothetical protein
MEAEKSGFASEASQAPPAMGPEATVSTHPYDARTGFPFRATRGLAWRLATTYLLTTSFTVFILSVAVYLATFAYLNERLDAELISQADFYAAYGQPGSR